MIYSGRLECVWVSVEIKRGFKKEKIVGEKKCEVSFNGYINGKLLVIRDVEIETSWCMWGLSKEKVGSKKR